MPRGERRGIDHREQITEQGLEPCSKHPDCSLERIPRDALLPVRQHGVVDALTTYELAPVGLSAPQGGALALFHDQEEQVVLEWVLGRTTSRLGRDVRKDIPER